MADVPFVMDFAKSEDDKRVLRLIVGWTIMGRPFLAPPGIPEDRKAALRQRVRRHHEGPGVPGRRRQAAARHRPDQRRADRDSFLQDVYATPKPLVERAGKILAQSQQ